MGFFGHFWAPGHKGDNEARDDSGISRKIMGQCYRKPQIEFPFPSSLKSYLKNKKRMKILLRFWKFFFQREKKLIIGKMDIGDWMGIWV